MDCIIRKIMQNKLFKAWGIHPLNGIKTLRNQEQNEFQTDNFNYADNKHIIKLPLQFTYLPIEIISKELTKLNSKYQERIIYLGPRWNDSFQWHKKFSTPKFPLQQQRFIQHTGYYFNERRVLRNNSFIHDSMRHNRFFKNEVYYRAFQGMNPTLNDEEIIFQSRFQSGNLDCVVKINDNEYDLFLRIDTNTRGHLFWYYFTVCLPQNLSSSTRKIRLNICNIKKSKTLYERNLKPYVKRTKLQQKPENELQNWTQGNGITDCKFKPKRLRYPFIYEKINPATLYELSFNIELKSDQQVSLAYCIPYTYSCLMKQLRGLQRQITERNIQNVVIGKLGQTLTGVQVPLITIGDVRELQNPKEKKVVFITARTHPGQTNSSFIISSLLNQLCLKKTEQALQNRVIFVIIPMLNPDGVILGNGRCSALGRDLNRQFKSCNSFLNPEVFAIKRLIDKIQQDHEIQMYFDFHGHSKKKNMFFFGPNYSIMDPNYYRCRVFPKILAKNLEFFRYYGCSYTLSESKNTTARAVMLNEFDIPFFYTVQTSIGFYYNYIKRQDVAFCKNSLSKIGTKFKQSLKEYFEGVQQYELFLKGKKKQKIQNKPQTIANIPLIFKLSTDKQLQSKQHGSQQKLSNLKLIKMFEQIKTDAKNIEKVKKEQNSETDSDSCRDSEQLQKDKTKEFSQMLITFNKIQQSKLKFAQHESRQITTEQALKRKQSKRKQNKNSSLLNDELNLLIRKLTFKSDTQFRIHLNTRAQKQKNPKAKEINLLDSQAIEIKQQQILKPETTRLIRPLVRKIPQLNISAFNFYRGKDLEFQIEQNEKIGVVNFSKFIQNPRSLRYTNHQPKSLRITSRSQKRKNINTSCQKVNYANNCNNLTKYSFPSCEKTDNLLVDQFADNGLNNQNGSDFSKPYPVSFYRIKYQSSHKKQRNKSPQLITQILRKKQQKIVTQPKRQQTKRKIDLFREPQKLFINITKI